MPITIYDLHKLFVEQQLSLASQQGLIESVSLRLSNVYGPSLGVSAEDRGILNKITVKALNGENLLIYGDGNYLRDYVYMDDVVRAFLLTGSKRDVKSGVYNVSSGKSVSVEEAFKMVASQVSLYTGKSVNVDYAPWPIGASPIEYRDYISDNRCISSQFGWYPMVTLESGIHRMVEGIIEARKGIKAFQ
jgi:nucleoside-diphosphate-sugar epimerase